MRKPILILLTFIICSAASAQLIATVEMKEPLAGICDNNHVYGLSSAFKGQVEPVCPISKEELLRRLNTIPFLKDYPKYKDKCIVSFFINCKGKVVKCAMDNKTHSPELDQQIIGIFNSINGDWKAGKLNGQDMDATQLYGITIKKGTITFDY